jgi:hypothetical protein
MKKHKVTNFSIIITIITFYKIKEKTHFKRYKISKYIDKFKIY